MFTVPHDNPLPDDFSVAIIALLALVAFAL